MKKVKTSVIMIKEVYFGKNINNHEVKVKIKKTCIYADLKTFYFKKHKLFIMLLQVFWIQENLFYNLFLNILLVILSFPVPIILGTLISKFLEYKI
jgi:hypothetical protein